MTDHFFLLANGHLCLAVFVSLRPKLGWIIATLVCLYVEVVGFARSMLSTLLDEIFGQFQVTAVAGRMV